MRWLLVVAFAAVATFAFAQSQPGPLRDPSNQSPDHQQIRGNDALDSIASQLSSIREQTARIEQQRTYRESDYWPPDWPNWLMLLVTGAAVVVAFRTLGKMERQTTAAENAANAATEAATAAKSAAETAVRELQMAYRPQLMVRHVLVDGFGPDGKVFADHLTNGYLWLTNVGVFNLTLVKFHSQWLFAESLPLVNPALHAVDFSTEPMIMTPASFTRMELQDREIPFDEFANINNQVDGIPRGFNDPEPKTLFLIGYVKYQDSLGLRRRYFCFRYNTQLHYFTPEDHPGYSYED